MFEKELPNCANPLGPTVENRAIFPLWDPSFPLEREDIVGKREYMGKVECRRERGLWEKVGKRAMGGRKARGYGGNGEIPRKRV